METDHPALDTPAKDNHRDHQFILGFIIGFLVAMAIMLFGNMLKPHPSDDAPRMNVKPLSDAYSRPGTTC